MSYVKVEFRTQEGSWSTPDDLFEDLDAEFGFDLDVAASSQNAKCADFLSIAQDGLTVPWWGRCWMNPPYGRGITAWVEKAFNYAQSGGLIVGLLPASTDTRWFHQYVAPAKEIRFLKGRLKFGGLGVSAPFPSIVVVW